MAVNFELSELSNFHGTENYYFHPIYKAMGCKVVYTDGVKYVANNGADWLLNMILSIFITSDKIKKAIKKDGDYQYYFFGIELKVNKDTSAVLTFDDGNDNIIVSEKIPYANLPMPGIKFFLTDDVLMLRSEY